MAFEANRRGSLRGTWSFTLPENCFQIGNVISSTLFLRRLRKFVLCVRVDVLCVCMSQKHYLAAKARAQIYLLALLIYFQYVTLYMCYLAVVYWVATTFDTRWMCRDATTLSQVADISCSLLCIHLGLSSSGMSDMYVFRYAIATLKTSFHFLPFFLLFPLTHQLSLSFM